MPLKTQVDDPPTLNLTPMIDVMFQLILFFMVGSRFSEMEHQLDLQVPQVASANPSPDAAGPRVVSVYADGRVLLDGTPLRGVAELSQRLIDARRGNPHVQILVRGDGQGSFQRIAEVLSACQQAEIRQLGLSVNAISTSSSGPVPRTASREAADPRARAMGR